MTGKFIVMEQRINIKFCFKLGRNATETYEMLKLVYGDDCLSRSSVFEWFSRFKDGREDFEDDARSGRPKSVRTPELIEKVRQLIENDRRMTLRMLEDQVEANKDTIHAILIEDLGKRKICSKFVPHFLTDEQKLMRLESSLELMQSVDKQPKFLEAIVTGDETWCFQYDPECKRQSMEWRSKSSPRQQKFRFQKSKTKVMLITFFDSIGIIHKEFVLPGQTVNKEYYLEVLKRLVARIHRIRPQFRETGSWMLLHDNARPHTAVIIKQFLAKSGIVALNHPSYSPDLSPADYFLFPKIKTALKGHRFDDRKDIEKNVTAQLSAVSSDEFHTCFQHLYNRSKKCVDVQGAYFEKY